ncbi:MAG TPA: putative aminohydrolase SsnA [Ktedonobacterales bacterium]|jgi:putative selenium metabolism protein SsnA
MPDTLIANATIATLGQRNELIENGALLVQGGLIATIGASADLRAEHSGADVVDARGGLVLPGFLCAHTHFYGAFARGMALPGEPPKNFLEILHSLWWRLDKLLTHEDTRASTNMFLVDAIRHGVTCVIDHHASPNAVEGSLDVIADSVEQAGIRACLAYEVSDRDGPAITKAGIQENERFIRALHSRPSARHGLLAGSFGLHASFTLSHTSLEACAALGAALGVGFHVHVAEDASDEDDSLTKYHVRAVERLERNDILGSLSIAAHCVHVNSSEIGRLAHTRTNVVHNARSNMNNAVGVAPVKEMREAGVNVGLGNDGFSMNMLQEMKVAYLLPKLAGRDPRLMPGDVIMDMAFARNARIAEAVFRPFADIPAHFFGELRPGAAADLAILDYDPPTLLTAGNLPWHLIFGADGLHVRDTMVAGRWLMRERTLLALDEARIMARARELSAKLWERM